MKSEIETRWEDLVKAKDEFIAQLSQFSETQFNQSPASGWSASQVLEHIIGAEYGTLGYMKKKSSGGWETLDRTGDEHIAMSRAVNARLASPEKYSAPSILSEPTNAHGYDTLLQQWNALRTEMSEFLNSIPIEHHDKLVFRQPVAGMLNVLQAMEFMQHHILHHIPQLHRIKAELS